MFVDRNDLRVWASQHEAPADLPRLIRRLVLATTDKLNKVAFRAQEGISIGGWDGLVVAGEGTPWVPEGASAWELSAQEGPSSKAESDFQKRTADPGIVDPRNTTFVFATPRAWEKKNEWGEQKRQEGPWLDVLVRDIDDLATWLDGAPTVAVWFAHLIGRVPTSAQDLESFWSDWAGATQLALPIELLAAGRSEGMKKVHAWLKEPASALLLRGETEDEAVAVFAAAVLLLPEEEREELLSRSVVVRETAGWRELAGQHRPSLLIPTFSDRSETTSAVRRGHHVCIPVGRDSAFGQGVHSEIALPRIARDEARALFQGFGVGAKRATALAELAHRGIPLLRRELGALVRPRWAQPEEARSLVAASLVGRWKDDNAADTAAVAEVAGVTYEELVAALTRWENEQDRPIRRVGTTWLVTSREDSWSQLAHFVSAADLERLSTVIARVLTERDPAFDLPNEDRWAAAVKGAVRQHSAALREGLAETLALMGSTSDLYSPSGMSAKDWVCGVVRDLLAHCGDWQAWASLSSSLSSLAEACPEAFLYAIEHDLAQAEPLLQGLFVDRGNGLSSSPHTYLLWALERLAWSPAYVSRAAVALARLAEIDPGGRLSNRPTGSLHEIFRLWRPCTAASSETRLGVLDMLRQRFPDVAWALLLVLLPEFPETGSPNAKPRWRDWLPAEEVRITRGELLDGMGAIASRLLADVGTSPQRWVGLIPRFDDLPEDAFDSAVAGLGDVADSDLTPSDREEIAGALRRLISHHAEYPEADWAMKEERLERLRTVLPRFEDKDPVRAATSLFARDPRMPDIPGGDWRKRVQLLGERRATVVEQISAEQGVDGLLELASAVEDPWSVGSAAADADLQVSELTLLSQILDSKNERVRTMADGFVARRTSNLGEPWVRAILTSEETQSWTPAQRGSLLIHLPLGKEAWNLLGKEQAETEEVYWSCVPIVGRGRDIPADVVEATAINLQNHGRYAAAVDLIRLYGASDDLVANALELLAENAVEGDYRLEHIAYEITSLLEGLEASPLVPAERIARLEWVFLGLQRHGDKSARYLERSLATDPRLFVQLLELVYKAEGEDGDDETQTKDLASELSIGERNAATRASQLLFRWSMSTPVENWTVRAVSFRWSSQRARPWPLMVSSIPEFV